MRATKKDTSLCTGPATRCGQSLCGFSALVHHTAIQLHVIAGHAIRVVTLAGAVKGAIRKAASQFRIFIDNAHRLAEAVAIISAEIYSGWSPDFSQRRNVIQDKRATRECRF